MLVAGAYGVIGRQTALLFAAQPDTTVIGLSHRTRVFGLFVADVGFVLAIISWIGLVKLRV